MGVSTTGASWFFAGDPLENFDTGFNDIAVLISMSSGEGVVSREPSPTGSIIHLSILRLQFREDPECLIDCVHFIGQEFTEVYLAVDDRFVVELANAEVA